MANRPKKQGGKPSTTKKGSTTSKNKKSTLVNDIAKNIGKQEQKRNWIAETIEATKGANLTNAQKRKALKETRKIMTQHESGKTARTSARAAALSAGISNRYQAEADVEAQRTRQAEIKQATLNNYANLINGGQGQSDNVVNPNDDTESIKNWATDFIS